jgi:SAM-dependent methyltransferase
MRERFEQIYETNEWGFGSGEGSLPVHTRGYARFLQRFLRRRKIQRVVDLGCGDWQFSRYLDWEGIQYDGYDLVHSLIQANQKNYSRPNVQFHVSSGLPDELPPADLLIAKDVLQHWSHETIRTFLPHLPRYRFSLITNCVNPQGGTENQDIRDGEFRCLDLRRPPFNLAAREVFSFTNYRPFWRRPFEKPRWRKKVLLLDKGTDRRERL